MKTQRVLDDLLAELEKAIAAQERKEARVVSVRLIRQIVDAARNEYRRMQMQGGAE